MSIKFSLKARPNFKGVLRVLEYFEMPLEKGALIGLVDSDIKKQHAKEYDAWKANVEANDEALYAKAISEYEEKKV